MATDLAYLLETRLPHLSKGQAKIARAVLSDYDKTAYMTAGKLAELVGVSESTVVRFAIALGFDGYPEFQAALQKFVRAHLTPNQRIEVSSARMGSADLFTAVMNGEIEKIKYTAEHIDRAAFDGAVEKAASANRIYVMGVRSSSTLASFLHYNLSMICDSVSLVQPTGSGEILEQMLDIQENDLLIAISFPRYSSRVQTAVRYAKANGASVMALTDSPQSPIAGGADFLLEAQSDMVSFVDSLIAPLATVNAFLAAVASKRPEEVRRRLDKLESIWDAYNVYDKR